ncbi:MAG: MFS transporter [Phycisphaerales bacterium]|nr:MFS transporter [Phycisphaerales bacterium]
MPRAPPSATLRVLDDLRRQLFRLRAFATLTYPFACVPFLFLYFRRHGMSEAQYGEIVGAYYVAMFLAEVPTGMLADRIGPKAMMVAGPLLLAGGFLSLLAWPEYPGFVLAEVLLGFAHAVLSGPPATLLYETLQRAGQEQRFLREESRLSALRMLGTGVAFLLGGALARWSVPTQDGWEPTIVATAGLCAVAAVLAATLHGGPPRAQLRLPAFLRGVAHEVRRPAVLWLLGYWVVLFALLRFPFHDYQPYLRAAGGAEPLFHDPLFVGLLFALMNLAAAPFGALLPRLVERIGRRPLFWGMPLLLCGSMAVMAWASHAGGGSRTIAWLGVSMFFLQQIPFGMHWALLQEFVNHRIAGATRTTVLSALSLAARAVYAGLNIALFRLQDDAGLATALIAVSTGGAAATCAVLWLRPRGLLRGDGPLA